MAGSTMGGYAMFLDKMGKRRPDMKSVIEADRETASRARKVTSGLAQGVHELANEPSVGLFRLQEHVVRSVPQLCERKKTLKDLTQKIRGAVHDAEYAVTAIRRLENLPHIENLQKLTVRAIQLQEELNRRAERGDGNMSPVLGAQRAAGPAASPVPSRASITSASAPPTPTMIAEQPMEDPAPSLLESHGSASGTGRAADGGRKRKSPRRKKQGAPSGVISPKAF